MYAALVPLGAAIAVAGVIYGATSAAAHGAAPTIAMSLLVFSGTIQYATIGLLASGAGPVAVLLTAFALNLRNLVLGAVIRPRLSDAPAPRRAFLAWFLVDESFGLAMASGHAAARMLLLSGVVCYVTWQVGTLLGVIGAEAVALEGLGDAVFPVLFIGLAAITAGGRAGWLRAVLAGALVALLAVLLPDVHAFAPILAALAVALLA